MSLYRVSAYDKYGLAYPLFVHALSVSDAESKALSKRFVVRVSKVEFVS